MRAWKEKPMRAQTYANRDIERKKGPDCFFKPVRAKGTDSTIRDFDGR